MKSRSKHIVSQFVRCLGASLLLGAASAWAQTSAPAVPVPDQANPHPKVHHDRQNSGHAVEEKYWGVTDGNRAYNSDVDARLFGGAGWAFPREAVDPNQPGEFVLNPPLPVDDNEPAVDAAAVTNDTDNTMRPNAAAWGLLTGPSTGAYGNGYRRTSTVGRVRNDPEDSSTRRFTWRMEGTGAVGAMTRYRIYVWLPARAPADQDETRVTDARYYVRYRPDKDSADLVYYRGRNGSAAEPVPLFVDQDVSVAGWYPLRLENGDMAPFFPVFRADGPDIEIVLDNTTAADSAAGTFVIADAVELRQQMNTVRTAPVVTARHGGRKMEADGQQPLNSVNNYTASSLVGASLSDYITGVGATSGEPINRSTYFMGPTAFLDDPGTAITNGDEPFGAPLFSHMQVLVARTEYIPDPDDLSRTESIEAGSVYALDWMTGAPVWRFPDLSYEPGGARNPYIVPPSGSTPGVPTVPGIRWIDRNGDEIKQDDEFFTVGSGGLGGGFDSSVTFAPRVPVRGRVLLPDAPRTGSTALDVQNTAGGPVNLALAYAASRNGIIYALDAHGNNDGTYTSVVGATGVVRTDSFRPATTNVYWTFQPEPRAVVTLDNTATGAGPEPPGDPRWTGTDYSRAAAVARTPAPPSPAVFRWTPPVAGLSRGYYAVFAEIPAAAEPRVADARYTVYDADHPTGVVVTVAIAPNGTVSATGVDQSVAGSWRLGDAGSFMRYEPGQPFAIELDNTTAGDLSGAPFVVADAIRFEPLGVDVPETAAFTSSPNIGYADPANEATATPANAEQRLFVGNDNGVLYAMNADADAAAQRFNDTSLGLPGLPFRKAPTWWFRTEGAITSSPALSASKRPTSSDGGNAAKRAVYVTTQEGRVYSLDWEGPVTTGDSYNSITPYIGRSPAASAALLNGATARPRWSYPNRYAADAVNLGPIQGSPSVVEFNVPQNSDPASVTKAYVAIVAPDDATSASPGRVYLLNADGDRTAGTTNVVDRYSPDEPLSYATPAWMYRFIYGDNNTDVYPQHPTGGDPAAPVSVPPKRRTRPTLFVGGIGTVYALDIDPTTDLFMRWPSAAADLPEPTQVPAPPIPADETDAFNPAGLPAALQNRPIYARSTALDEGIAGRVSGLAITGGPLQIRGTVPNPTYAPQDLTVNQDINDPLTHGDTTSPEWTFQYPVLFVSTETGGLHEISTNIEGEDLSASATSSSSRGWALTTDPLRRNLFHILLDTVESVGGVAPAAPATNVVFEGLDPFNPSATGTAPFRPRGRQVGDTHTGQTGYPLDLRGLYNDPYNASDTRERQGVLQIPYDPDSGQTYNQQQGNRIVWLYTGGLDGTIYGFTPGDFSGGGSGPTGSVPPGWRRELPRLYRQGDPKVDIFDQADFDALKAAADAGNAVRPNRDGSMSPAPTPDIQSRAAKGKLNFFEWGESIYIVVWDLNARTATAALPGQYYSDPSSVTITITNRQTGAALPQRTLDLERIGTDPDDPTTDAPATYENLAAYDAPDQPGPRVGEVVTRPELGLAFLKIDLDDSTAGNPQTPGNFFEVRVTQRVRLKLPSGASRTSTIGSTGGGANDAAILNRLLPVFAIANPINVAGGLIDTQGAAAAVTGIGPLGNSDADKDDVATGPVTAGTTDPDKPSYDYSQNLTNGNTIVRRDYRPYATVSPVTRNLRFTQVLENDDVFYMPVASSLGYAGHGSTGTTGDRLYIRNRSRLGSLGKVRIVRSDMLWRWWPGSIPHLDAGAGNPRLTPAGMSDTGVINPLPWETVPGEVKPWKRPGQDLNPTGTSIVGANTSAFYPDIPRGQLASDGASGDLTRSRGVLPPANRPVQIQVKVPRYQPANLAATSNYTSTYVAPNSSDTGVPTPQQAVGAADGPVQLPRGVANRRVGGNGITPFGYATRLFVFVDSNLDGNLNISTGAAQAGRTAGSFSGVDYRNPGVEVRGTYEEAFREFETWMGVPVDMRLKANESLIDLGKLPHGFGVQNGLLGYGGTNPGFVPPPINNSAYAAFYKNFTVQNLGNTNLYNVRAAQRFSTVQPGNSLVMSYMGMVSDIVNPNFGINSWTVDPRQTDAPSPFVYNSQNVVTSLDPVFDPWWHNATGAAGYPAYYAQFQGMHTLHKPMPGAPSPTLLSIPDSPDTAPIPPGLLTVPQVGVAVPIGTPSGSYSAPLAFFEDHDTPSNPANPSDPRAYRAFPTVVGNVVQPAGPLYGGQNRQHPGAAGLSLLTGGGLLGEGILRPRGLISSGGGTQLEFLPYTDPSVLIKATVGESALTGQIPDTLNGSGATPGRVTTGALPFIDAFPLGDTVTGRPAAALTPAAFRSAADGSLYVFFSRNATNATTASTAPGASYNLFWSKLTWNVEKRAWEAANPGAPLTVGAETSSTGRWFTAPAAITPTPLGAAPESNTSPYVLQYLGGSNEAATLFWLNTVGPVGNPQNTRIFYAPLSSGSGTNYTPGTPVEILPASADRTIRRFGPKAVLVPAGASAASSPETVFAFYYGGVPGRWSLLYAPLASSNGVPTGTATAERQLALPGAIASAAEPSLIHRWVANPTDLNNTIPVVDVYYTGVSRASQSADIFMSRYRVNNSTSTATNATLVQVPLPRVPQEKLESVKGSPVYMARHIDWWRSFNNRNLLPEVYIAADASATPTPIVPNDAGWSQTYSTMQARWQYDDATGLLFQQFNYAGRGLSIVYVDVASGSVRFRGPGTPQGNEQVYVTYTPQTYRLTTDSAADVSPSTFFDTSRLLSSTDPSLPLSARTGIAIRRTQSMYVDRQWVTWQKGGLPNRPATLYWNIRRVGIDLKAVPGATGMAADESLALNPQDNVGNQTVSNLSVTIDGATGESARYEVDFKKGHIYVPAENEGRRITVTYSAHRPGSAAPITRTVTNWTLGWIDEDRSLDRDPFDGSAVRISNPINEGQPLLFRDPFDGRPDPSNPRYYDPTLQPGRIWLFWTSPATRTFDLYWQTLVPNFESFTFGGI